MKVEEIAAAIAKLPPDQLARFRRWFAAFEAGRSDHAKELDSTATKLGRLAGRACRQNDTLPSRAFFAQARVCGSATRSSIAGYSAPTATFDVLFASDAPTRAEATMTVDLSPCRNAYQPK
jgi:hypothetical protein